MSAHALPARERGILAQAFRGQAIAAQHSPSIDALGAMGFVSLRIPCEGGFRISLTITGLYLGRAYVELARWELWRDLYERLLDRASIERDRAKARVLFGRAHAALGRAQAALKRAAPDAEIGGADAR